MSEPQEPQGEEPLDQEPRDQEPLDQEPSDLGPRDPGQRPPGEQPRGEEPQHQEPQHQEPQDQEPREVWSEVGRRFEELGRSVRGHLEPESPDSATWTPPPTEGPGPDRRDADEWAAARDAVRRLGASAQRLAAQAGDAARDPAVRESAQQAARTLGTAVSAAIEDFGAELRGRMRSPRWSDADQPRPTSPPPVAPFRPEDDDRPPTGA